MKILLIGCGKMGSGLLDGWQKSGIAAADITVVDPFYEGKITSYGFAEDINKNYTPDFVLLAVKPQNIDEIMPHLKRFSGAVFISIIAGKTIAYFRKQLPNAVIIRTMPNLPALIGKGITAAVAGQKLEAKVKSAVIKLLEPCGKLIWLDDENLINSVTAISGSGPAYVFLFAQSLIEAGQELGLDEATAKELVLETIKGSIALAETSGDNLVTLKENVTSKGGTTAAALEVLETGDALKKLIKTASKQAKLRAEELAG